MSGGISKKVSLRVKHYTNVTANQLFDGFTGILQPLQSFGGIQFPYTPTIGIGHSANYGTYETIHSVSQPNYYSNTQNPSIGITAQFTANDKNDARYTAAALQFFKSCTKSEFGEQAGERAGTPPPVLILNAYGIMHAENVPVVLTSVNYNLTEDVDYVEYEDTHGKIVLPTTMLITLDLRVQQTPRSVKENFNINTYASGRLLKGGGFM